MLGYRTAVPRSCASPCDVRRLRPSVLRVVARRAAAVALKKDATVEVVQEVFEELDYPEVLPSTQQIQGLLKVIIDETDIAEVHLQMGTFELKVRRSLTAGGAAAALAPAPSAPLVTLVLPDMGMPTALQSMDSVAMASFDESLIYVTSPKVGILRRGRFAAGKRVGKGNVVNEGDQVKKGQTLAFVEQLGTYVPVEAPQAGEVVNFEVLDGGAVEYGELVVQMAPYFGGHIIGDLKHA